jgi:hypothetical protein
MRCEKLGQPCRNFQILGIAKFADPRDGREKVVLSNFAAGATGCLVFIDPDTGAGESIALPGDHGAWAVLNLDDEKLLVGTCAQYGYLHCLDLRTRQWAAPLRDPQEQYIWNLCLGSDGLVYGGTWPGCVLLRYDPVRQVLENMGRVSDHAGNMYSRTVYGGIPGHILISCGCEDPHLALWHMDICQARRFGRPGAAVKEITSEFVCTETQGELDFYDVSNLAVLDRDLAARLSPPPTARYAGMSLSVGLRDGRALATRGQEYYLDAGGAQRPALVPIPAPRPATRIHTLTADPQGRIWGSAGFGQTIFCYDPAKGQEWNSQVVCDNGGEVYGMAFAGDRLFMAAYSGGDHIVYDPGQPWNQLDNLNPRTLEPVGPALIRPSAKSLIGPDGNFWTGWMAQYGTYGGGLSRVDVRTLAVTSWYDPVPGQAVISLAADEQHLYFVTGGQANGLPTKEQALHFVVWSPAEGPVWRKHFPQGSLLRRVAALRGCVLLAVDDRIEIFDPVDMHFESSLSLEEPCHYLAALRAGWVAAFCGTKLWAVDPVQGTQSCLGELPGQVDAAAVTPQGEVYCAVGTELCRLVID